MGFFSVESFWDILVIISLSLGILATIYKLFIEPFVNRRKERLKKESKEVSISFINLEGRVSQTVLAKLTVPHKKHTDIKLDFDVRKKGDSETTVKIIDAKFKVKADDNNEYFATTRSRTNTDVDLSKDPLRIDIVNAKQKSFIIFRLTDLEYDFKEAWARFKYTFLDSDDNTIPDESDWMKVNLILRS